jgi:hypothetical protein
MLVGQAGVSGWPGMVVAGASASEGVVVERAGLLVLTQAGEGEVTCDATAVQQRSTATMPPEPDRRHCSGPVDLARAQADLHRQALGVKGFRLRSSRTLLTMTYDLAVWEGERPDSDAEGGEILQRLYTRYIEDEDHEPTARIRSYAGRCLLDGST